MTSCILPSNGFFSIGGGAGVRLVLLGFAVRLKLNRREQIVAQRELFHNSCTAYRVACVAVTSMYATYAAISAPPSILSGIHRPADIGTSAAPTMTIATVSIRQVAIGYGS